MHTKLYSAQRRLQLAIKNGLPADASGFDPYIVHRPVLPATQENYNSAMKIWDAYKTQFPRSTPTDLQWLKHYAMFLGLSTKGVLDPENDRPTTSTIRNKIRTFCSAWQRVNKIEIDKYVLESMAPYIEGELADSIGLLKDVHRTKKFFTIENYSHMQTFHWEKDFYNYIHEGSRIDSTNLLNAHCFTSARLSEICQATYQDVVLMLTSYEGQPEFRLTFKRRICKGLRKNQPEHPLAEFIKDPEGHHPPLFAQPMFHMLANIISSKAYPDISTVEQALEMKPPANAQFRIITLPKEAELKPVFPEWTSIGPSDKHQNPHGWANHINEWGVRTGLAEGVSVHCIRREVLIKADDNGHSIGQVLKFASQKRPEVLVHHYLSNISTIDGAANFLGMERRTDLAEPFRSATMKFNPDLIHSIPMSEVKKLEKSEEYILISDRIKELKTQVTKSNSDEESSLLKLQIKAEQNKMQASRKRKLRELQISQPITYKSIEGPHEENNKCQSQYDRIKHMLPLERIRLAEVMTKCITPRSKEWVSALRDLVTLRTTNSRVAFQEKLRPVNGHCPMPLANQWSHIYNCYKVKYKDEHGFAKFCFLCSEWMTSKKEWEDHCLNHLNNERDIPLRCDPVIFRYGTACAGYCPVHLQDTTLPAHERLKQHRIKRRWEEHIAPCLADYITTQKNNSKPLFCPHLFCQTECISEEDFGLHLNDLHGINLKLMTGNNHNSRERKRSSNKRIFITKSPIDFSRQPTIPVKNVKGFDDPEYKGNLTSTFQCEKLTVKKSSLSEAYGESVDVEEDTNMEDSIDPALYEPAPDSPAAAETPEVHSDHQSCNWSSSDEVYEVDCILAKWKNRQETLYLVKWKAEGTTWQPAEDVLDQKMIENFESCYQGFKEGIEVLSSRTKNNKVEYHIEFTDYKGSEKDARWWVPEKTMHPDHHIKGPEVGKKKAKRRKICQY
ncbi:hypothetical protein V8C42DRAFT_362174 [Trichoderma barbatum]